MPNRKIKTLVWCSIFIGIFLLVFLLIVKTLPPPDLRAAIQDVQSSLASPLDDGHWEGHKHSKGIIVKNAQENAIWLVKSDSIHCLNDSARRLSVPMMRKAGMPRGRRPTVILPFR